MRLFLLLFFSAFSVNAFDYYSVGGSLGFGNIRDSKDFSLGAYGRGDFTAYTNYFYAGASIGLASWKYSGFDTEERIFSTPICVTMGTSSFMSGSVLDSWRYSFGLALGYNQGLLNHKYQDSTNEIHSENLTSSNFTLYLEGTALFNVSKELYLGPTLTYRFGSLSFKDEPFSGGHFASKYTLDGFSVGVTVYHFWGNF